jgi:hypothetical protein
MPPSSQPEAALILSVVIPVYYEAVFRREVIQSIPIEENGFGFEPEITAKLARSRLGGKPLRIYELGISYHGRKYHQGKKIGWKDGLWALWCIVDYNLYHPARRR